MTARIERHDYLTCAVEGLPEEADLAALIPSGGPFVLLDSARTGEVTGRWSLLGWDPWLAFKSAGASIEICGPGGRRFNGHPLAALEALLARYRLPPSDRPYARALGLLGYLCYEMNRWIEALPEPQAEGAAAPEMAWYGMRRVVLVDHQTRMTWRVALADPQMEGRAARTQAAERLEGMRAAHWREPAADWAGLAEGLRARSSQAEFERGVHRLKDAIAAGEIFQANLSQRFSTPSAVPAARLYRALRALNPSPFACLVQDGDRAVISASPERLVRVEGGAIDTRPIAGTRPRGADADADAALERELRASAKERAEHIMLVDLERNDLGRVCRYGSVRVEELMQVERYSHVMHLVSQITGRLRPGTSPVDVIRAVFPGGTITGCPKVRCMQLLRAVEPVARGVYTGSVGAIGFEGGLDLNIAIRTWVRQAGELSFHVGAGIVADSDPAREYEETLAKGRALAEALQQTFQMEGVGVR